MSWPIVNLGEVCERVSVGHVGKTTEFYTDESGVPFLRTQNISNNGVNIKDIKFIASSFHEKLKKSTLSEGDLILSRVISTQINCGIIPKKLDGANCANIILIRPIKLVLNVSFLNYYLKSETIQRQLLKRQVGSAQSVVNTKVLKSWEIPLPPVAEQQKIAEILDAADALRQKDQQLIDHYTALSQSLFLDMFGDPLLNPKEWNLERLDGLTKKKRPITYGILKPEDHQENGVIMLRIQDIKGSVISITKAHKVSHSLSDQYKRTLLSGDEIVISLVGTIGLTAKVPEALANSNVHRNLGVISLDEKKINRDFFYYFTLLDIFKIIIKKITKGCSQPLLNLGSLNALLVYLPPIELQNQFVDRIALIEKQKQQAEDSLAQSNNLFHSLLQKAFTGELTQQSERAA